MITKFKLFENDLYSPIPQNFRYETIPMDIGYRNLFKKMLSKYYKSVYDNRNSLGPVCCFTTIVSSMAPSIDIRQLSDEWFIVSLWYRDMSGQLTKVSLYKCDQADGVKKLLKDKHII